GSIDNPVFIESKFWNVDTAFGLIAGPELDKRYLYYFCLSIDFKKLDKGTTLPSLVKKDLIKLQIPIPPLPEQKQIVAILDQAFAAIDQAKANIQQNIDNARELFQSKLNEVFSQKGDGWEEKKLGEVCKIKMGQSPKGSTYTAEGNGIPLINGPVEFGPDPFSKTVKSKWTTHPTKMCEEGDLILCVRGSTTGKINIAGFSACIGRGVASLRYNQNQEWLNFFILGKRQQIYNMGSGATFPNVSGQMLAQMPFVVPPDEVQNQFVLQMKQLQIWLGEVEEKYRAKIENLDELKKSILQRAFSGELTSSSSLEEDEQGLGIAAEPKAEYGGK
ncbi:MAG: restriction endonuclease subunit S, partial [Marinoscillum sp.]